MEEQVAEVVALVAPTATFDLVAGIEPPRPRA